MSFFPARSVDYADTDFRSFLNPDIYGFQSAFCVRREQTNLFLFTSSNKTLKPSTWEHIKIYDIL